MEHVRVPDGKDLRHVTAPQDPPTPDASGGTLLARHLCRVMGRNENYLSRSGTAYHIQVEDRGPIFDDATESWVRRLNVIAYANYGEPTARIVFGRDHDLPDVRTHGHNREVGRQIQELVSEVMAVLEEREQRLVLRIQDLLKRYYGTRDEEAKREFEEANTIYPFVFARAFQALRAEKARMGAAAREQSSQPPLAAPTTAPAVPEASAEAPSPSALASGEGEVVYPLDPALRELVLEIERVSGEIERDMAALRARGAADDIVQTTCAKLVARARESLVRRHGNEFAARHLEMTRNSLVTAYRQVRARLARAIG
jgi:hypothetical protein